MFFKPIAKQLIRDMQASMAKTAVLGLLFLVGLYFWVPPLFRALTSSSPSPRPSVPAVGLSATAELPAVRAEKSFSQSAVANDSSSGKPMRPSWKTAENVLATDPLVRSAEVAAIQSDPFRMNTDQFPPPNLFADEPAPPKLPESSKLTSQPPAAVDQLLDNLVLKSTIVGVSRRAALINQRLYREGAIVRAGGEDFELIEVHPRKVVLKQGARVFELKLPDYTTGENNSVLATDSLR